MMKKQPPRRIEQVRFSTFSLLALCGLCGAAHAQEAPPSTPSPAAVPAPTPEVPVTAAPLAPSASAPSASVTVPNLSAPLSLDDALKISFQNHGDVAAARETLTGAALRVTSAKAARAPQLSGTIGSSYQNGQLITAPVAQTGSVTTTTTGIGLSQNLFDSGRTKFAVRQSRAAATSQLGGLGTARNSLGYTVAQRFFEQLRQQRLVSQRRGQVAVAQNQLDQIQAQIDAGSSPRSDLAGARVTLSQARFDLVTAQNDLRNAQINLRNALGLERGPALQLAYESPQSFDGGDAMDKALEIAEQRRPDLLAAQAQIAAAQAALKSAQIETKPNVSATLGYNLDPRATDNRKLALGATVSIPIFNGGGRKSDAKAAFADLRAAQIRLAQTQRDVQTDVETAVTNIGGQIERLQNARELVQNAQNNFDTAQGRYSAGAGIALDVTVAQSQLFQAQTSLASAEFDYQIARSNLDRATGRFAWESETLPNADAIIEGLR